jgi:hypothetical protein
MFNLKLQKPLTGLEIGESSVKVAQILRNKKGWSLLRWGNIPFPEDTLKLSYKTENINDPESFIATVREALKLVEGRVSRVGVSLPNEVVKVATLKFTELPKSKSDTEKMIAWWSKKTLPFPVERAKISYHRLSVDDRGEKLIVVAIGFQDVIREYEANLKELKINSEIIRPAGINHLNFYIERIPPSGVIAFIGLFENYFTFFVFEDGGLVFYHGIKRGFSGVHFFQDVEMTMQLYLNDNPDKEIERVCYGSQVGFHRELERGLRSISSTDVFRIDEDSIISLNGDPPKGDEPVSSYAAVIAAAQSLAY